MSCIPYAPDTAAEIAAVTKTVSRKDVNSLGVVRYIAWVSLVLILAFAVALAIILGNTARSTLLSKQKTFASIMAEHLNHQIFVRFTLPTVVSFGRIALRQQVQYERLDSTVKSLIHGLNIHSLRIFDHQGIVTYSVANRDEAGLEGLASEAVTTAITAQAPIFDFDSRMPYWKAFFRPLTHGGMDSVRFLSLEPGTFYLRTTFPLRMENRANSSQESGPILGVLEFTQDITADMMAVVRFQWSIIGLTLFSALILFSVLMVFIQRAENALALRVQEEQRLLSELHQHEKLAGMGRVVAGIAHEIRNPLGIIRSSAELLLRRESAVDPSSTKILHAIFDESKRLSQTVSDFLDYAKPRPPQQNPVDIVKVILEVLTFLEPELNERKITVEHQMPAEENLLVAGGDKGLFYRAFYNILMNSVQAIEHDGSLIIQARLFNENDRAFVSLLFRDTGPGFPEDKQRLLDPFVTTKHGGTGLGLPIVNNIISSQQGHMTLDNDPQGGAVVRVVLPAWAETRMTMK